MQKKAVQFIYSKQYGVESNQESNKSKLYEDPTLLTNEDIKTRWIIYVNHMSLGFNGLTLHKALMTARSVMKKERAG